MTKARMVALLLAAAAGCEDSVSDFRAAVILPSAIDDFAFSQSLSDALDNVRDQRGVGEFDFAFHEDVDAAGAEEALRAFARDGYDLIIAHGVQYDAAVTAVAKDFPSTAFALGTTSDTHGVPNLYAYDARAEEGGYVNGAMAAKLSTSGVLGVVGPLEVADAKRYVDGFVAGARDTVPGIDVRVTYIGSFDDVAASARAAQAHLDAGADVLTGVSQMVSGAIGTARDHGVVWFGTQSDQTPLAPTIVAASQVYRWEAVLGAMIDAAKRGSRDRAFAIGLADGGEEIVFNPAVSLPADVRLLGEQTIARLVNGTLQVALKSP